MARVNFTTNLRKHVQCPEEECDGATVREVLDAYFAKHPRVRSYMLDEHGELRHHVVVFVWWCSWARRVRRIARGSATRSRRTRKFG